MIHLKLFEDFKENEPAVITKQLKEIDKVYTYFFTYDEKLKDRFEIDTTGINEKQGLNYWYYINLFENDNGTPMFLWKIYINITLNDLLMPSNKEDDEMEAGGDALAGGDMAGGEMDAGSEIDPAAAEAPVEEAEEELYYEEAEEDVEGDADATEETAVEADDEADDEEADVTEPTIENCFIRMAKYDYDTSKKIAVWEDNAVLEDILNIDWLLSKIDETDNYTLKVPKNQSDVEQVKKRIKSYTDLHYQ